jgi:hypothetical protein
MERSHGSQVTGCWYLGHMSFIKRIMVGFVLVSASSVIAAFVVRKRIPAFGTETDGQFSLVAAMDGASFESTTQKFEEGRATAFMGGIKLDLVNAELMPGAFLTLRAFMGGMDIIVPADWRVEVMARSVMGGIGNLTDPDSLADDAPVLLVDALAVMGGIEIHQAEAS